MLDKINIIETRLHEIDEELASVGGDYERIAQLGKERAEIEPLVTKGREYRQALENLAQARDLINGNDAEMAELAALEIEDLEPTIATLEKEIRSMLLPKDPRDERNVIVEIRAGAGGDEAGIFAADLFRMYTRYAERLRWKIELLDENETGVGGYKEVIFMIKGNGAFSRLKYESGVHRVQRVPVTESQGRIHTRNRKPRSYCGITTRWIMGLALLVVLCGRLPAGGRPVRGPRVAGGGSLVDRLSRRGPGPDPGPQAGIRERQVLGGTRRPRIREPAGPAPRSGPPSRAPWAADPRRGLG